MKVGPPSDPRLPALSTGAPKPEPVTTPPRAAPALQPKDAFVVGGGGMPLPSTEPIPGTPSTPLEREALRQRLTRTPWDVARLTPPLDAGLLREVGLDELVPHMTVAQLEPFADHLAARQRLIQADPHRAEALWRGDPRSFDLAVATYPGVFRTLPEAARNDVLLASIAVQVELAAVDALGPVTREDPSVMARVVQCSRGALLGKVPPALLTRASFYEVALELLGPDERAAALQTLPAALRDSPDVIRAAAYFDPSALSAASDRLRADPRFVRELLDRAVLPETLPSAGSPQHTVLEFAAPSLLATPSFAKDVLRDYGSLLAAFPATVRGNPDVVRAALESSADAIAFCTRPVGDPAAAEALVRRNGLLLKALSPALMADPKLQALAVESNPAIGMSLPRPLQLRALALQPSLLRDMHWTTPAEYAELTAACERDPRLLALRSQPRAAGTSRAPLDAIAAARPDLVAQAEAFTARCAKVGIRCPERLGSFATALELVERAETLDQPSDDPRPLAVVVYSPEDWNGALGTADVERLKAHYRVVYREASTDQEVGSRILEATRQRPAQLLLLGAHGARETMSFGAPDPALKGDRGPDAAYLTPSDVPALVAQGVGARVAPGGAVVLLSCHTGQGREEPNQANAVATLFPQARIFAPVIATNMHLMLADDGSFQSPGYLPGDGFGYVVEPRAQR